MKKLAMIAAGALCAGCLSAFDMPALGVNAQAKYSSERVSRGRRSGKNVFLPKAEINMPMFEKGKLYVGTSAVLGADGDRDKVCNYVSPYIGASYSITDVFTLDAGYYYYFYTNTPKRIKNKLTGLEEPSKSRRNSSEIYFGVLADVLLSPSLYFYYDLNFRETAIEGKVARSFDLARFGANGLALDLSAKLGYDHVDTKKSDKDYIYHGLNADLVYSFNEHAKARVGVAYEGNSAKKKAWTNSSKAAGSGHHKNFVWFNASVNCAF